jgi:salicylate hydroxylase
MRFTTSANTLSGKDQFTVVGGFNADPSSPDAPYRDAKWNGEGSLEVLKSYYKEWHPSIRAMIDAAPSIRLYPNLAGAPLSTYVFQNRITLLGDAAHTHGGGFAAGGSLAIDDAYAFSLALKHVFPYDARQKPTVEQLGRALKLYEATRKGHVTRLLELVHKGSSGQKENIEKSRTETEEALVKRLKGRPNTVWISEHDVEKTFWETVRRVEGEDAARANL